MKRGIITITDNVVYIPDVPVWMTLQEIADLFGVYCGEIRRKMKMVYKEGVLSVKESRKDVKVNRYISMEVYSLEFVIAICFRIGSWRSRAFKKHLIGLTENGKAMTCLFIREHSGNAYIDN